MAGAVIMWLLRCAKRTAGDLESSLWYRTPVVNIATGERSFIRFCPFWPDETIAADGEYFNRPPWWRPFNILLHCWQSSDAETMHDHPRWSITICLRNRIIEHTPWKSRALRPGSIVLRTHRAIHRFEVPPHQHGNTWTLFIVGRRRRGFRQNSYRIIRKGIQTAHIDGEVEGL